MDLAKHRRQPPKEGNGGFLIRPGGPVETYQLDPARRDDDFQLWLGSSLHTLQRGTRREEYKRGARLFLR